MQISHGKVRIERRQNRRRFRDGVVRSVFGILKTVTITQECQLTTKSDGCAPLEVAGLTVQLGAKRPLRNEPFKGLPLTSEQLLPLTIQTMFFVQKPLEERTTIPEQIARIIRIIGLKAMLTGETAAGVRLAVAKVQALAPETV